MNMKLSHRDKIIFLVVTVVVVIGLGIWFLLKPRYEDMKASDDRLVAKQAERDELQAKIDTLPDLKKTLENKVDEVVERQEDFISEREIPETYQINTYLMDLLAPSEIEITGMDHNVLEGTELEEYTYNRRALGYDMKMNGDIANQLPEDVYNAYNNSYPAPNPSVITAATVVTISYRSDPECEQLFDAIQLIADCDKNIYMETCSADLTVEASDEGVEPYAEGEMVVTFYEIYPMDPADVDK